MSPAAACGLGLALLGAQAMAWGLARALRLRLPWRVQAAGLGLPLAVLLPLLAGNRCLAPVDGTILGALPDAPRVADPDEAHGVFNDAVLQLLPWEAEVRRGFAEGHLPLWSDLLDGGSSPWVNPQAAVLSPVAMLGRLLPLEHFLLGTLAVKMLLAFEGCWLLARLLGARRSTAALGAGGFALGGPVMAWAVFPLSSVVAWSPWLAVAAVRVVRRPGARQTAAAAAVVAALLLAGHPEIALAALLVAAGIGAIAWRRRRPGRGGGRLVGAVGAAAVAAALGAGLAACQLVPFGLAAPRSLRAAGAAAAGAVDGGGAAAAGVAAQGRAAAAGAAEPGGTAAGGIPERAGARAAGEAAAASAPAPPGWFAPGRQRLALGVLSPWAFGRPFHEAYSGPLNWPMAAGGYLGLVGLAGAAAAPACRRRLRLALALGALAAGVFLLTAGFRPLQAALDALPLGRALAVDRFLPAAALPLAVLAALGLEHLFRRGAAGARAAALLAAAAAASLLVRHDPPLAALWLAIGLAVAAGRRWGRRVGAGLLALVALADLVSWDRDVLPRGHRELFYPRTPLIAAVADAAAESGGPWRAVAGGFGLYPSLLPMYGVADVRSDNPMALAAQLRPLAEVFGFRPEGRRYKSAFGHLEHPLLDFLNVRVVVLDGRAAVERPLEAVRAEPPLRVFRNTAALPRWFLAVGAEACARGDGLRGVRDLKDPRRVVLDAGELRGWRPAARAWDPAAVRMVRARRGAVSLALPPDGEKLLATSLPFPEGWTAAAGGRGLRRLTVDTAYLGVIVPAGVGRVDLAFAPPGFAAGMALSALAAAAVALLAAWPRRRAGA